MTRPTFDNRPAVPDTAPFVRVARDAEGRTLIALDAAATEGLATFLDTVDVSDWRHEGGATDPDEVALAADTVSEIKTALMRHLYGA